MAHKKRTRRREEWKELLGADGAFFKQVVQEAVQEVLEAEMDEALQAGKYERTESRLGYRSGGYPRTLLTRVGTLELRLPQDRQGRFSTEVFERYQRSEKALVRTLVEIYGQGGSTRKVKAVTEHLWGHEVSAATVSRLQAGLAAQLEAFATRPLEEAYPYLVLDARYERVREDGGIRSRAVLIAVGINEEGRRCMLGVELANRESPSSWRAFLEGLRGRGLRGVEFVVSDDHPGLVAAIHVMFPEAAWQRCYVHFLRNALDHLPQKADDDCLMELRWMYDRRDVTEARRDLAAWLSKWQARYPQLWDWVEAHIESTWTYDRLPRAHHKHVKSTNMLERVNQEIRRRTQVVRIFPHAASCLHVVRALTAELHETWIEGTRYLNMELWREQKKTRLRTAA